MAKRASTFLSKKNMTKDLHFELACKRDSGKAIRSEPSRIDALSHVACYNKMVSHFCRVSGFTFLDACIAICVH